MTKVLLLLLAITQSALLFSAENEFYIKDKATWSESIQYVTDKHQDINKQEAGGTQLLIDIQQNIELKEYYNHYVVRLEDETGVQNYSDLMFDYDPSYQQLIFHELVIHRNGKKLDRLVEQDFNIVQNETQLESRIYNGNYSASINIKDVQVGDIIEYAYTIKGENPIYDGKYFDYFSLDYSFPVSKLFIQIVHPKNRSIYYRLLNSDQSPQRTTKDDQVYLTWELENIEEIVPNTDLPMWYNPYATVQLSEFSSWREVIQWSKSLYTAVDISNTELERQFVEITKNKNTRDEKINALIRFVQEEIRYVGIEFNEHSHRPHQPLEVYNNRFGDCKDKSYLLVTLLRHLGVETWIAYAHTNLQQEADKRLPSPNVFNHAIVAIKDNHQLYFVDPTMTDQRGDYKALYNGNYKKALVINEEHLHLTDIPIYSTEKIVIHEHYEITDSIKATPYSVYSTFYGSEADKTRSSFNYETKKELEVSYLNFYDYLYPNMHFSSPIKTDDDPKNNIFNVEENYEIEDFWTYDESPSIRDYQACINASSLQYYISTPLQKNRTMPFSIYHPIEIENKIEYADKKDINIDEVSGEIKNPCFRFTYDVKKNGNTVEFNYTYKSLKDVVLVEELDQYYKDIDQIANNIFYTFTYGSESNGHEKGDTNWIMLIMVLFFGIILSFIATKLYTKDLESRAISNTPKGFGGWLILPSIGVCITPLVVIYGIIEGDFFSLSSWEFISSPESDSYNTTWMLAFIIEMLGNVFIVVYSVFIIFLLFKRRTTFPTHYIIFRTSNIAFLLLDAYLISTIESEYITSDITDYKEIGRQMLNACIWIPYMLISLRVKNTFTNKFKTKNETSSDNEDITKLEGL